MVVFTKPKHLLRILTYSIDRVFLSLLM